MASPGELSYQHFIIKLVQKASTRRITVNDTHSIGSRFWGFMSEEFKEGRKIDGKRHAFWNFAQMLKNCIVNGQTDDLFQLWEYFDTNGRNMFENMYENCLSYHVSRVL
jgi:hypothetical protein